MIDLIDIVSAVTVALVVIAGLVVMAIALWAIIIQSRADSRPWWQQRARELHDRSTAAFCRGAYKDARRFRKQAMRCQRKADR